jgi:hypothetical protein
MSYLENGGTKTGGYSRGIVNIMPQHTPVAQRGPNKEEKKEECNGNAIYSGFMFLLLGCSFMWLFEPCTPSSLD